MSEIQNAIEVKNLKKGFGGRVLFENFSLNVKANTIHAIIGPNGSGKTTLLRLITGVYQPNAGTINIAGEYGVLYPTGLYKYITSKTQVSNATH